MFVNAKCQIILITIRILRKVNRLNSLVPTDIAHFLITTESNKCTEVERCRNENTVKAL